MPPAALLAILAYSSAAAAFADELPSDAVGSIDGAAIAVSGPMKVEIVNGFVRTMLRSGSEVRVKSGTARLELVEGGFLSICGPAHFSVLKSRKMLTVALETGVIHAYLEGETALNIYTPQIQAQVVAIGGGVQEAQVGFDATGAMCIHAYRGAVRLEQQLTGQSVLIPQSGDIVVVDGQLDNLRAEDNRCSCDPQISKYRPPPAAENLPQTADVKEALVKPAAPQTGDSPAPVARPAAKDEPIYEVYMPPLVYDAKTKVHQEFDPKLTVLVRRVRVRPSLIFQGRVEGEALVAKAAGLPKQAGTGSAPGSVSTSTPAKAVAAANDSFSNRVRSFVKKLWSR